MAEMNAGSLPDVVKELRCRERMTQQELSIKSGVGLRFVRELEQGKPTVRLDKVNQLLDLFNYELRAVPKAPQAHPVTGEAG